MKVFSACLTVVSMTLSFCANAYVTEPVLLPDSPNERDDLVLQFETGNCHGMGLLDHQVEVVGNNVLVTVPITFDSFCFPVRPPIVWEFPLGRIPEGEYTILLRRWEQVNPPVYEDLHQIEATIGNFAGIPALGDVFFLILTLSLVSTGVIYANRKC